MSMDQICANCTSERWLLYRVVIVIITVGENGWPYVQFRGGPKGFLKVIDQETLGYLDHLIVFETLLTYH